MSVVATFEQLFYGSGRDGYGILAASPGAESCRAAALALCESFGTPSGADSIKPFLLCRRDGDRILFARAVQGRNDAQGRRTIFVHVLVAPRKALESAQADPFALAECGLFRKSIPNGTPGAIDFELTPLADAWSNNDPVLPLPVVVRASGPISATLVRSALGDRPWERSWATWSWRFIDGFAFQGLSPRTPVPDFVALCDEAGKMLRAPATATAALRPPTPRESVRAEPATRPVAPPSAKTSKGLLAASLLLNATLGIICAWVMLKPQSPNASVVTNTRPQDETGQRLAEILERSYPEWKSGSLDAFLDPIPAKLWKKSSIGNQSLVYQFLAETYSLAEQSARKQQP